MAEVVVRAIRAKGSALGCPVMAIGWMPDHVHVLVQLKPSVALAELVRHVKGSSARAVNSLGVGEKLRWQGGYGAFAVCRDHLYVVRAYVENQPERHAHHRLTSALEVTEADEPDATGSPRRRAS
jgi:REP element-mobilizing transposase RayT